MSDIKKHVLITGDFVLDHHIYEGKRHHFGDRRSRGVQQVIELGGAALVHYLLAELKTAESHLAVAIDDRRQPGSASVIPDELKAFAFWRPFLRKAKDPESAVWRTSEAMGFGGLPTTASAFSWPPPETMPERPDIVVISEGGMDFRRDKARWPMAALDHAQWIVLKTTYPLAEGELWETLTQTAYRKKLVVLVSAHELRKTTAQISTGLSWEQTLESVFGALEPQGALAGLTECRHLVITFESDGGLWLDQSDGAAERQALQRTVGGAVNRVAVRLHPLPDGQQTLLELRLNGPLGRGADVQQEVPALARHVDQRPNQ